MCWNSPSSTPAFSIMASDSNSSDSTSPLAGIWVAGAESSDAEEKHNVYFPFNERSKRKRDWNILHFIEEITKETPIGASTDVPQGGD
jgi:hypothetical protein